MFNLSVANPAEIEKIEIFDMQGRKLDELKKSEGSDLKSLGASYKPGMYLVKVHGTNWSKSIKIIKGN